MRLVVLDFESFFSTAESYTLSKMSTEAYIRDPRFQAHGVAIKVDSMIPAQWWTHDEFRHWGAKDWKQIFLVAHHCAFDGLILSHVYDVHPARLGCTLSMARMVLGNHLSVSLDSVRKHFNIPAKFTPYKEMDGKHWNEMTPYVQQQVAAGACDEVESIWKIFHLLLNQGFPPEEIKVIDTTIKFFTEPVLRGDVDMLAKVWEGENTKKQMALEELGVTASELQSADKFAALLREEGVEPEMKNGKNGEIYAFAKTDQFMRDLLENDNDRIRTLAEARIGQKSTLLQTRAETLGWMARRGPMPVYLRYCGAHTTRWSGGDGCNWQNFKRGSDIRKAIMAPDGFLLAAIDSSQIECRLLNYLAGQNDVIEKFRNGEDPYVGIASAFYGRTITKAEPAERGTGKQAELSCLGPDTLVLTQRGPIPITAIQLFDRLWDGDTWVGHCGVVSRGERFVINVGGLWLTPDHLVLCETNHWLQAVKLHATDILCRALVRGSENLPLQDTKLPLKAGSVLSLRSVLVELPNIQLCLKICAQAGRHVVTAARKKLRVLGKNITTVMQMFVLTNNIAVDYLAGSVQLLHAAAPMGTKIMGGEAYASNSKIDVNFWRIWLHFRGGITRVWKSIASIQIKDTNRVIFALLLKRKTIATDATWNNSPKKMKTYDIAYSGPNNRFTVVSPVGPLIVHNCGYGCGADKFKATARLGIYGPPVILSDSDAKRAVGIYRASHPSVVTYWQQAEAFLPKLAQGAAFEWGPLASKNKKICLPNGTWLNYDTLEWHVDNETGGCYWRLQTRSGWSKMYGAKFVENIIQALARVVLSQAMLRIEALGYRILNTTHDEVLVLIPKDGKEEWHVERCAAEMKREPVWLPGIPLDAEWSLGERYAK